MRASEHMNSEQLEVIEISRLLDTQILDRLWADVEAIDTADQLEVIRDRLSRITVRDTGCVDARPLSVLYASLRDLEVAAHDRVERVPYVSLISLASMTGTAPTPTIAAEIRQELQAVRRRMDAKWAMGSMPAEAAIGYMQRIAAA